MHEKQQEQKFDPLHSKTSSRYVQKNHLNSQILGEKESRVWSRRKLAGTTSHDILALLSLMEPQNFAQANQDEHWINAMMKN